MPYMPNHINYMPNHINSKCNDCEYKIEDNQAKSATVNPERDRYCAHVFEFNCNVFCQNGLPILQKPQKDGELPLKKSVYAFIYSDYKSKPAVTCGFEQYVYRKLENASQESHAEKNLRFFYYDYILDSQTSRNNIYNWKSCVVEQLKALNNQHATDAIAELSELNPFERNYEKTCRAFRRVEDSIPEDQVWIFLIFIPKQLFDASVTEIPPPCFFPPLSFIYCIESGKQLQDEVIYAAIDYITSNQKKEKELSTPTTQSTSQDEIMEYIKTPINEINQGKPEDQENVKTTKTRRQ